MNPMMPASQDGIRHPTGRASGWGMAMPLPDGGSSGLPCACTCLVWA